MKRPPGPFLAALLAACASEPTPPARELPAYPNPFGPADPLWSAQPHRDKPLEVVVSPDGARAYVSLQGTEDDPGRHVAVVDVPGRRLVARVPVPAGPTGLALHPDGRWLVVLSRFADRASVIDTRTLRIVASPPTDPYASEAVFTPDGGELWVTNRWRDTVTPWTVDASDFRVTAQGPALSTGDNPRDVALSADGRRLAAAALTGLTVSLVDPAARREIRRIDVGAPPNGLAFAGDWLVVATLSAATHHPPLAGPDTDGDGRPGDGTPNVNFQDLQNEIAVFRAADGAPAHRYTSDTICCRDYRDVDPADAARHGDLLPPRDTWIVGGALPEQVATAREADGAWSVYVTYAASDEVQRFTLDAPTGRLSPGPVWPTTGHDPHGLAIAGDTLLVAHHLSETLGFYDRHTGAPQGEVVVGDLTAGPYPATDVEIGELFNEVTAPFTVDGDQACVMCHREGGNIAKAFSMPLTRYPGLGLRMTMAYRGAADTRPWFFEAAMDQTNFKPVINEFARVENFCCSDYTLWPEGAPADCATNPPPACDAQNPSSGDGFGAARGREAFEHPRPTPHPTRDAFFLATARRVIGRAESFGDGLYFEDPITGVRRPIPLDFDGLTRALGLFLLAQPRLPPNPNAPDTAQARRGRALFESPATGCATCHPAPSFAASTDVNPFGVPVRMRPVVTPMRDADGTNLDLFAGGFMDTFPTVEMETCDEVCGAAACAEDPDVCDDVRDVRFGAPGLRGIWDRAARFLHDGRARTLREVLCTPGHPALRPGETGYNERDGVVDAHGGTSHLTPAEIEDLIAYLLTL